MSDLSYALREGQLYIPKGLKHRVNGVNILQKNLDKLAGNTYVLDALRESVKNLIYINCRPTLLRTYYFESSWFSYCPSCDRHDCVTQIQE